MTEQQDKKFSVKRLKEYFGVKPGDSIKDFAQELNKLSEEEKIQLDQGIENGSLDY